MKLVKDWKQIALYSYSMWAFYLGTFVLVLPEIVYATIEVDISARMIWALGFALQFYGIFGRLVDQSLDKTTMRMPIAVVLIAMASVPEAPPIEAERDEGGSYTIAEFNDVAVPLIGKWEGLRTEAYLDRIAKPPVWTVCYGETKGVKQGDSYSKEECDSMLAGEVLEYREGLHEYFTQPTLDLRLTAERDAAYTSLAYNAGVRAIGKSTATRRLNAGDIVGGCKALGWWNKAGGRVIRGLVNRRAAETELCLKGVV